MHNFGYTFKTTPWEHQLKALDFLYCRDYGALFTTMGSGKTKIAIDLIVNRGFKKVLIVSTKASCDEWVNQISIHSNIRENCVFKAYLLSTSDKYSKLKEKHVKSKNFDPEVIICNYDSVWRKPFSDLLKEIKLDCVICDESHKIKAAGSKVSMYLHVLGKKVKHKYILTGTPISESPLDIYGQYRFLNPEIFGTSYARFCEKYQNIDPYLSSKIGFPIPDKKNPYKNLDDLKSKVFDCAFYTKTKIVLPKTKMVDIDFTINTKVSNLYQELTKEGVLIFDEGVLEINNVLTLAIRQQQLLSGYVRIDSNDYTKKLTKVVYNSRIDTMYDLMKKLLNKHKKFVVFAMFKADFEYLKKLCSKLNLNYGEISGSRNDYLDWKRGNIDFIAIQYSSGSESISLVESDICIYYTLPHSSALYEQSLKRIHRPGQTKDVTYYRLIAHLNQGKSIDQKIVTALKQKKDLADYIKKTPD